MKVESIQAIDVHAHLGCFDRPGVKLVKKLMSGDAATVLRYAGLARVQYTIVSPLKSLMPRLHAKPFAGNAAGARIVARTPGLRLWVVVDPLQPETYAQAVELLRTRSCVGMKIHPEEHGYPIEKHGRKLFEFAEAHGAVVITHSGEKKSLPSAFVKLANDFPTVKLIMSHLGCGWDNDITHQVRAIQKARHGNVFTDTSSAKSICTGLLEWAVGQIGADRILFGTDSPLYYAPMQRARVNTALISDGDKKRILRDNAAKLLGL